LEGLKTLTRFLVALILLCALPSAWLGFYAFTPKSSSGPDEIVEIHRSDTHAAIIRLLVSRKIIDRPTMFNWVGRATRQWRRVKAGEYKLSAAMSPFEIFETLTSGISVAHPITVREGENMYEIAADIESKGLSSKDEILDLCKDGDFIVQLGFDPGMKSLEGFLYPDTYYFNKTMSAEDMVRQMVHHANQIWTQADDATAKRLGMTRYQVITLASIIEKETGAPNERPLISSVFHNRLKKKMRLQSDPTTIYGMWSRYQGKIHHSDLLQATPFNTYTIPGLPVGPISNPGRESITAALNPAQSDYLFFVSHNDGTHEFTTSLEDHNRAVRKFQLDPKAREGKSWRDLTKKLKQPTATN
jgi:UPF0755 protein